MKKWLKKWMFRLGLLGVLGLLLWIISPLNFMLPGYHSLVYTKAKYQATIEGIQAQKIKPRNAQSTLDSSLLALFPFWYGTRYDFNGTTETPGRGRIACGYFVTTVLRDAGFRIPRTRLAIAASETMIKAVVSEKHIRRFSKASLEDFLDAVREQGEGVYLLGLDTHTGFLVNHRNHLDFIHASNTLKLDCVRRENAAHSTSIQKSTYRVLGKLSLKDPKVRKLWLAQ